MEEELTGATDSKGSGDDDDLLAPSNVQEDRFEEYDGDYQAEDEDDEDDDFVATSTASSSSSTSRKRRQPAAKKSSTTKAKRGGGGARGASKAKKGGGATTATRRASKRRRKSDDLDQEDGDDADEDGDYVEGSSRRGAPRSSSDARDDEDPTMDTTTITTTTTTTATTTAATSTSASCIVNLGGVGSCSGGRTCGGRGPSLARLPMLCREVLRCLPPPQPELEGNEALPYDPDAIQALVLDLAVDPALHAVDTVGNAVANTVDSDHHNSDNNSAADAERRVVTEAVRRVAASTSAGGRRYRLPQRDGYDRRAVLALYEAFLASPKQQKKRSYRMEGAPDLRSLWTEERIARFQIAFRKYGYSPTSNRKIAEAIGEGIHANHVADFKRRYKKVLIKEGRLDELKSISGIRMKKIEQKMNQLRNQQEQRQQKKNNKTNKTKKKPGTRVSKRALAAAAAVAAEAEAASAGLVDAAVDSGAVVGMVADVSSSDASAPA